jgi:hypothetical protein
MAAASETQRQLAALRQRRAEVQAAAQRAAAGARTASSPAEQQPPSSAEQVAARLARTLEAAAVEQRQRRAERATARPPEATFREQMNSLSRGSHAWAKRSEELGAGIAAALDDRRAATAEFERRRSELVTVQAEVATAQSELDTQERKLADAAAGVDAALKSDTPVPWLEPHAPPGSRATAAIVCTLRAAPRSCVQSFISHHLGLGFAHIYLFFDAGAADPSFDVALTAARDGRVSAIARNSELEAEQRTQCSLYSKLREALPTEIMARQQLNCETAAHRAASAGFDWLLHIDIDEAFHLPPPGVDQGLGSPVETHFGSIDPAVIHVAYLNHEAVPEQLRPDESENYFKEHTLFRRNPHCVPGFWEILDRAAQQQPDSEEQQEGKAASAASPKSGLEAAVDFWIRRTVEQLGAPSYFLAYVNGKSAVRLRPRPGSTDAPRPSSVHRWEGQKKKCAYFDPDRACVLHYVNCGLGAFRTKYEMLAECTTSDWFHALPLYPRARDAAAVDRHRRAYDDSDVPSEIEALYREVVVLEDAAQVALQLETRVCVRVHSLACAEGVA